MTSMFVVFFCAVLPSAFVFSSENGQNNAESSFSERLTRLEEIVLNQKKVIRELEREKDEWRTEREQRKTEGKEWGRMKEELASLTAEWTMAKQRWQLEKESIMNLLMEKTKTAKKDFAKPPTEVFGAETSKTSVRDFAAPKKKVYDVMTNSDHERKTESHDVNVITGSDDVNIRTRSDDVNDIMTRSDDVSALEPVVTQTAQRVTELSAELQTMRNTHKADLQTLREANVHQDQAIQETGSSVYVRWGNSRCPNSTSLVYSGVVAGSHHGYTGGVANPLCMSMAPVGAGSWGSHGIDAGGYSALFGAEYQTFDAHTNKDPVCAVCRAPRPTVVMVPGTNRCMSGWNLEYSGFLMAGKYGQTAATQYICVDSTFESRIGGDVDETSGYELYFTVAHCGSLPCQPYVSGHLVTCAVCSE